MKWVFQLGEYYWKRDFNEKTVWPLCLVFFSYGICLAHYIQFSKEFVNHVLWKTGMWCS